MLPEDVTNASTCDDRSKLITWGEVATRFKINNLVDLVGRYSNFPQHLAQVEHLIEIGQNPGPPRLRPVPPRIHKIEQRLDPSVMAQIATDYEAGMTSRQLMSQYQLSKGTVLKILEKNGVSRRYQPLSPEQCAEAIDLYLSGWSMAKVGRRYGRGHTVIRDLLKRRGITRR